MVIISNKIQCNKCKQIIESIHTHDYKFCKCDTVGVDGGKDYLRRMGKSSEYTELSEFLDDENKIIKTGSAK